MSAAKLVGTPVRVDMNTLNAERGKFARICVELDLTKPVLGKLLFTRGCILFVDRVGAMAIILKLALVPKRKGELLQMMKP